MYVISKISFNTYAEGIEITISDVEIQFWKSARAMTEMTFILSMIPSKLGTTSTGFDPGTIIVRVGNVVIVEQSKLIKVF